MSFPEPELTDGVVLLRRWEEEDAPCVTAAAEDPGIPEGTTVPAEPTPAAVRAFVHRQWSRAERGEGVSLAIGDAGTREALGLAVLLLRPQPGVAGVGYWVIPRARRRGLATRAVRLLADWGLERGGLARVEAWVEPGNEASHRVLRAAGFDCEGVLRSFLAFPGRRADAVVYARIAAQARPAAATSDP